MHHPDAKILLGTNRGTHKSLLNMLDFASRGEDMAERSVVIPE